MTIKKFGSIVGKLIAAVQIAALALLVSCTAMGGIASTTVCHATGDAANPYEQITVTNDQLTGHLGHVNDINPAPLSGCPTSLLVVTDHNITFCHANGNSTNPYDQITVNVNGLNGHGLHQGDVFPGPDGTCPTSPVAAGNGKITICHATGSAKNPYNLITVSVNGLNGHDKHQGDIIPAPAAGCPTTKP